LSLRNLGLVFIALGPLLATGCGGTATDESSPSSTVKEAISAPNDSTDLAGSDLAEATDSAVPPVAAEGSPPTDPADTEPAPSVATSSLEPAAEPATLPASVDPPKREAPATAPAEIVTEAQIRERLAARNPNYNGGGQFIIEEGHLLKADLHQTGISDLSPLAGQPMVGIDSMDNPVVDLSPLEGMPLEEVYLEGTLVRDLSPLAGMPIKALYISNTRVYDLSPLEGIPLVQLNAVGSSIRELDPLAGSPLEMVWLSHTAVSDIGPLAELPIVSLTMQGTRVTDLSPVRKMPKLERLHIGESHVTDLTPLEGLHLTRLVFSPGRIKKGIDVIRNHATVDEIGTLFQDQDQSDLSTPAAFWARYDAGEFIQPASDAETSAGPALPGGP